MQQVSFAPIGREDLIVTGVYVSQYLFPRAYGNYLGLCRLGQFMAKQIGRRRVRVNCIATIAMRGSPKAQLERLSVAVRQILVHVVKEQGGAR